MLRQGQLTRQRMGRVSVYRLAGDYLERWSRPRYGDSTPDRDHYWVSLSTLAG